MKDDVPEVKDDVPAGGAPKGGIRVSLVWSSPVDLDLYVTDPKLETVYFANTPSGSEGVLEEDVECKDVAGAKDESRSEVVVWEKKRSGRYRVGVDFMDACDSDLETVAARVVAEADGKRHEQDVTLELERFNPVVLEFDVSGGAGGESAEEPEAGDEDRAKPAKGEEEVP